MFVSLLLCIWWLTSRGGHPTSWVSSADLFVVLGISTLWGKPTAQTSSRQDDSPQVTPRAKVFVSLVLQICALTPGEGKQDKVQRRPFRGPRDKYPSPCGGGETNDANLNFDRDVRG
ncbi:hypothetical protein QCA50_002870 [Cerrena zonata]|uniref:Secreted protein n=1 Tax=Cerrena zonata TaxID=2478898 RepID=A0AAW0GSV8_9APHY